MKHLLWTLLVIMGICFLAIGYVIYAIFVPVRTFEVKNFSYTTPIHIDTPVLHAGDVLKYRLDYCKYTDVAPVAHRTLVDGQIIPLSTLTSGGTLPMGCHTTERDVTIPETINPGKYYLNVAVDYPVNPFHTEHVYYYTEYFQVVGKSIPSTSEPAKTEEHQVPLVSTGDITNQSIAGAMMNNI